MSARRLSSVQSMYVYSSGGCSDAQAAGTARHFVGSSPLLYIWWMSFGMPPGTSTAAGSHRCRHSRIASTAHRKRWRASAAPIVARATARHPATPLPRAWCLSWRRPLFALSGSAPASPHLRHWTCGWPAGSSRRLVDDVLPEPPRPPERDSSFGEIISMMWSLLSTRR
jgi:hypothetical protein